jgi:hypothetical protein
MTDTVKGQREKSLVKSLIGQLLQNIEWANAVKVDFLSGVVCMSFEVKFSPAIVLGFMGVQMMTLFFALEILWLNRIPCLSNRITLNPLEIHVNFTTVSVFYMYLIWLCRP